MKKRGKESRKHPKEKKGVSDVIVTILLILLVLAAIIIIWRVILPILREKGNEADIVGFTENINVEEDKTNFLSEPAKITVTRGTGEAEYSAIKVVFYSSTGSYTATITEDPSEGIYMPKPLETKTYYVSWKDKITEPTSITIYIQYTVNGKDKIGPIGESFDKPGRNCAELQEIINKRITLPSGTQYIYECGYQGTFTFFETHYYDPKADINNDKNIDELDLDIFKNKNGDEPWCLEQLLDEDNLCEDYACSYLWTRIGSAYGADCADTNYDIIADIIKDGFIGGAEYNWMIIYWGEEGEELCAEKIRDTSKIPAVYCQARCPNEINNPELCEQT